MITAADAAKHIGAGVVYSPPHEQGKREEGVITSANERFVFVRYGADKHSKATHPDNLDLLYPGTE